MQQPAAAGKMLPFPVRQNRCVNPRKAGPKVRSADF